jgi:PAS domain S-box-containing protein
MSTLPPSEPQISPLVEQQIAILLDLTRTVTAADDLPTALEAALQPIAVATGWCYGEIWRPIEQQALLRSVFVWHEPDPLLAEFAATSSQLRFMPGIGMLGHAWRDRTATWVADVTDIDPARALRPERVLKAGLRSAFILPIIGGNAVLALMVFFARPVRPPNEPLIRLINLVAAQVGAAIQRIQAQEQTRAQEALLRSVTSSALDAIVAADPDGNIMLWNQAAARMFGYSPHEALGQPLEQVMPLRSMMAQEQQAVLEQTIELHGIKRDQSAFPIEVALTTWRGDAGTCLTAIIRDVSERKRHEAALLKLNDALERRVQELAAAYAELHRESAERTQIAQQLRSSNEELERLLAFAQRAQLAAERSASLSAANRELERAARLKDEFLANMSHELRTPLNAILILTEATSEGVYGPINERQRHALSAVTESGQHLLTLINDILDLTKIESGKLELILDTLNVADICEASTRIVRHLAQAKHQRLETNLNPLVETIQADPRRLKQILVNLLTNAVKFTPEGGNISLEVSGDLQAEVVHFSVSDTGIGITAHDLTQLFKPFVQLDSNLNRRHEGTGLGLALVNRLTELHAGGISVTSMPGIGSRFTISLPWYTTPAALPSVDTLEQPIRRSGDASRPVVLIAEDNQYVLHSTSDYLQANGYRILAAQNGAEAINLAYNFRPDIILMDTHMPVMDGLEAIRRLRIHSDLVDVPIIAMTALALAGDREQCIEAGAQEYISKPIKLQHLIAHIETLYKPAPDATAAVHLTGDRQ